LLTEKLQELSPAQENAYQELCDRRRRGEPLAYLLGHWEFWSLDLVVTPAVLIPRPETELLVEVALASRPGNIPQKVGDLGTGSGAIAVALACERPKWQVMASDCSPAAVEIARYNAQRLGLKVEFFTGEWLAPFCGQRFDLIVANPPYIAPDDPHLAQLSWEPRHALLAEADGFAALAQIAETAREYLVPGGVLALEHGATQGVALRQLLSRLNYQEIQTLCDLEHRERVTRALSD